MTTVRNESLRQLDLSDRQITIYQALLRLGPTSIRDIAAIASTQQLLFDTLWRLL